MTGTPHAGGWTSRNDDGFSEFGVTPARSLLAANDRVA
jgi:hypothetical protein